MAQLAGILALAAFVVYNANGREAYPTGDSRPTALLPLTILYEGDLDLNEYHPPGARIGGPIREENGRILSNYSPLPALLSLPIYLLAWPHQAEIDGDIFRWVPFFSKLSGSLFASMAVAAFFLACAQVASPRAAFLTALIFAFGSPFWMSASQTLGQHAPTALMSSLALLSLLSLLATGRSRWAVAAGTCCALAVGIRLSNVVIFATLFAYVLLRQRRHALAFVAPAVAIGVPAAVYLLRMVGGAGGGLEAFAFVTRIRHQFTAPLRIGLPGLLVSPGEGLLLWSPVLLLLLLPLGAVVASFLRDWRGRRQREGDGGDAGSRGAGGPEPRRGRDNSPFERTDVRELLLASLVTGILLLLVYAKYVEWWGGRTYGPRYATDALPFLLLPAAVGLERWLAHRVYWVALAVLLLWSSYVQVLGAFRFPCVGSDPSRYKWDKDRIWSWSSTDITLCRQSLRRPAQDFESARRLIRMTFHEIVS